MRVATTVVAGTVMDVVEHSYREILHAIKTDDTGHLRVSKHVLFPYPTVARILITTASRMHKNLRVVSKTEDERLRE